MSKYSFGDQVRVSNPGSFWFGQVGRVHRSYETRFGKKTVVIFDPAPCVSFEEWMLTLAEPTVTDVLDQMDKESSQDKYKFTALETAEPIEVGRALPAFTSKESSVNFEELISKSMDEREIDGEYVPGLGYAAHAVSDAESAAVGESAKAPLNRRAKTLRTAEELINGDRAKAYGDPQTNFGRIANLWNAQFGGKLRDRFTAGDVALALTHLKLSRLANTPDHADSFVDAIGYLALGAELADGL